MIRCTFAHVDLDALKANFRAIAAHLQRSRGSTPPGVIAVVKANAYGHGAAQVGLALEQAGATMLACADIEEGIVLRRAGVRCDILVFGALSVSDLAGIFDYGLTPTVSTPSAGRALQQAATARGVRLSYHLKIDTGMNRLGFRHDNLARTLPGLLASKNLDLDSVYTHFGTADVADLPLFEVQRERFGRVLQQVVSMGGRPRARHAANSAAIVRDPRVWFDYVRPGLLLYGVNPAFGAAAVASHPIGLKPVMSLRSRVVAVKGVRIGETVGYGGRFRAERPTDIAIVPAGYADGLDARLAGRGSMLIAGRRVPVIGSVCMDRAMLDVTGIPVQPGDSAVIIGRDGDDEIDVHEMARAIDSSPYEILCRIGTRIERVYNSN
jgi:alanine racemase